MDQGTIDEDIVKKEPSGDEGDRWLGICRYAVAGLLLSTVFNQVFRRSNDYQGTELMAFLVGTILPAGMAIWYAYYNFRQANHEKTNPEMTSYFSRPFIIVFVGISIYYIFSAFSMTVNLLSLGVYNTTLVTRLLLGVAILVILKRESIYVRK